MPTVFVHRPTAESLERIGSVRRFLKIWTPALAGVAIIATESTPTFSSANTSHWLRPIVESLVGYISTPAWEDFHHILRKTGHFSFYGLLCVLFVRGWLLTFAQDASLQTNTWRLRSWLIGVFSTLLVASADEIHQTFLPSRTGLFSDVLIDTAGGICMSVLVMGVGWWIRSAQMSAHLEA